MKTADIDYTLGGQKYSGYLVYDETVPGPRPGVLVVHEAWGLGEHAMARAEMLAKLGYVAFAADMYGDRRQIGDMAEMMSVVTALMSDPKEFRARGQKALDTLAALPQVDSSRLGAIGFCFGGSAVLELARSGADVRGVVSFHGGLTPTIPAESGAVKASVLVCTGADDPMVPPDQVDAFETEMRDAGADWQVQSYGNTVHSFTNPSSDGSINPAILYNERSDKRSWSALQSFFEEVFV